MLHVGNPIFLPSCLPFSTLPSMHQFLPKSFLTFLKFPFSRFFLIKVDEITDFFVFKGDGSVDFQSVAAAMAAIQSIGIEKIGIVTSGYDD